MRITNYILSLVVVTLIFSCTDDDDSSVSVPISKNDPELITNVELIFKDTSNTVITTFYFKDPDGEGGNSPTIDTIVLDTNKTYLVSARFLDASDTLDIENITEEIRNEDHEHIICYEQSNISGLTIVRTDSDGTYEVGLETKWEVGNATSMNGLMRLILRHQPGTKDGTYLPGETDVEIDFPVVFN